MNAIIAVFGHDQMGIVAKMSVVCAENNANVMEVNQTLMQEYFAMIMLVDVTKLSCGFSDFAETCAQAGKEMGLTVHVMHEEIFNSMHRI